VAAAGDPAAGGLIRRSRSCAAGCRRRPPARPRCGRRPSGAGGCGATEGAPEVADAGLDPDPPVAQPPERSGALDGSAGLAGRALAGHPDPLDAERGQGGVVGGGAEPAIPTTVPGGRPVSAITSVTAGTSWAASPGLPLWVWQTAMKPRSHSPPARCSRTRSGVAACPCGSGGRPGRPTTPADRGSPGCRQAAGGSARAAGGLPRSSRPAGRPGDKTAVAGPLASARRVVRATCSAWATLWRAMAATSAVSRSISAGACPVRRRRVREICLRRRPAARERFRYTVQVAAPRPRMRRASPPRGRTACSSRSASVGWSMSAAMTVGRRAACGSAGPSHRRAWPAARR
jgi:hypothetical protein